MHYTSKDITEEPDAVIPHVRICMGAAQVTGRPTMTKTLPCVLPFGPAELFKFIPDEFVMYKA